MKARRLYQRPVEANTDSSQPGSEPTAPMGLWPPTLRNIQRNSEKRADRNSHFAPLDQHRPVQSPARSLQGPCPAGGRPQLQLPSALRVLSGGHRAAPGGCSPPPLPSPPVTPQPPSPACPLTLTPCSTRTRSRSSRPKETLLPPARLPLPPMPRGGRRGRRSEPSGNTPSPPPANTPACHWWMASG